MEITIGDRMKEYESKFTHVYVDATKPILVRLDGRSFSSFTKDLKKPFDRRFTNLMKDTANFLIENLEVDIVYTQSDEITLLFKRDTSFFDGRIQKIATVVAGLATSYFTKHLEEYLPEKKNSYPLFDARVFNVTDINEAVNCIIWRYRDAIKNSVSMVAHEYLSVNSVFKKNTFQKLEMLKSQKGIDWETQYGPDQKTGTFLKRIYVTRRFTKEELDDLPEHHNARKDPNLEYERSEIIRFHIDEKDHFRDNNHIKSLLFFY